MTQFFRGIAESDTLGPYERLALAIIIQAVRDARGEDTKLEKERDDARRWLLGKSCRIICHSLAIDFALLETWVYAGCPMPEEALAMAEDFNHSAYARSAAKRREEDGR